MTSARLARADSVRVTDASGHLVAHVVPDGVLTGEQMLYDLCEDAGEPFWRERFLAEAREVGRRGGPRSLDAAARTARGRRGFSVEQKEGAVNGARAGRAVRY